MAASQHIRAFGRGEDDVLSTCFRSSHHQNGEEKGCQWLWTWRAGLNVSTPADLLGSSLTIISAHWSIYWVKERLVGPPVLVYIQYIGKLYVCVCEQLRNNLLPHFYPCALWEISLTRVEFFLLFYQLFFLVTTKEPLSKKKKKK